MKAKLLIFIVLVGLSACSTSHKETTDSATWYKGNTHCHSTVSDGDTTVRAVVNWYHAHGYNFLLVTDHNALVLPDTVTMPTGLRDDFILIQGEEVTDKKSVHTTAMNISGYVPFSVDPGYIADWEERKRRSLALAAKSPDMSKTELLQRHVDSIRVKGGITFLNHPNFSAGMQVEDILPVKGLKHFEVYNGHPSVKNWGKKGHPSVEEKWDMLLSKGYFMYGVASDDAHNYLEWSDKECNPGRAWIMVRSKELTPKAISDAVAEGDFYATMGIMLSNLEMDKESVQVEVDEQQTHLEMSRSNITPRIDSTGVEGFTIDFIGLNGSVLKSTTGVSAKYRVKPEDTYVRGRVTYCRKTEKGFEKCFAWAQPLVVDNEHFMNE